MPKLVEAEALGKRYGRRAWAARDVSFSLGAGQILGLAGPNGAGKTTILRMLAALIRPTTGTVRVLGDDVVSAAARVRELIGLLPENVRLYDRLTAEEHLTFCARVRGMPAADAAGRIAELLELFHLTSRRGDLLRTFSKGMIRRVALATAFLHRPRLLLLDEPTDGLDPVGARLVAEVLTRMKHGGQGMILCSHDLGLIEEIADQVAFVRAGRLVACGPPADMVPGNGCRVRLRLLDPAQELLAVFRAVDPQAAIANGTAELTVGRLESDVPPLVARLVEAGARVMSVAEAPLLLEDHYLKVMQDHET